MMKYVVVGLAVLAMSTSAVLAAKAKPKAAAAAAAPASQGGPFMGAPGSAADKALYMKNQNDSGMGKKKK